MHSKYPIDSNGTKIEVGQFVAFNKSGSVVSGTVREIYPRKDFVAIHNPKDDSVQWVVKIESGGRESVVKNTMGILIVDREYN